jgi:hypothetical protein
MTGYFFETKPFLREMRTAENTFYSRPTCYPNTRAELHKILKSNNMKLLKYVLNYLIIKNT